ncbi:unnamed protein product [Lactuca virosa]|uniref:Uncharacterized protein n=1 Tax=Lactuca virosa TaxID=75947 RepID=A0AAU9LLM0_9ASTR|nr:unnamed protein product [Lactuca virosa]
MSNKVSELPLFSQVSLHSSSSSLTSPPSPSSPSPSCAIAFTGHPRRHRSTNAPPPWKASSPLPPPIQEDDAHQTLTAPPRQQPSSAALRNFSQQPSSSGIHLRSPTAGSHYPFGLRVKGISGEARRSCRDKCIILLLHI